MKQLIRRYFKKNRNALRCSRCGLRIGTEWFACPFCGADQPREDLI